MDFHTLARRDLQVLCKRNGIRANMTNAAMADALCALDSVDGIEEIVGQLGQLLSPAKAAAEAATEEEQREQQGSPLPRGRRVSVKSPEAVRLAVEAGQEEEPKEMAKTPAAALRSTRKARATPAMSKMAASTPVASGIRSTRRRAASKNEVNDQEAGMEPLPTPATRRSQRTATARKAAVAQIGEDKEEKAVRSQATVKTRQSSRRAAPSSTARRMTRAAAKMTALDKEEEEEKEEQKGIALDNAIGGSAPISDEKSDDAMEEKVEAMKSLDDASGAQQEELSNKSEEPEQQEVPDSKNGDVIDASFEAIQEPPVSKLEQDLDQGGEESKSEWEPHDPLPAFDDSPIRGLISEPAPPEGDVLVGDNEGFGDWSPEKEMAGEVMEETNKIVVDEVQPTAVMDEVHDSKDIAIKESPEKSPEVEVCGDIAKETKEAAVDDGTAIDDEASDGEDEVTSSVLEVATAGAASPPPAESSPLISEMLNSVVQSLAATAISDGAPAEQLVAETKVIGERSAAKKQALASIRIYKDEDKKTIASETREEGQEGAAEVTAMAAAEAGEVQQNAPVDLRTLSMRKLKSMLKDQLNAKKVAEGKRLALAEIDENVLADVA